VAVTGRLRNGAVAAFHMQGGPARGAGLRWEISGTEGDLVVSAPSGTTGIQMTASLNLHEVTPEGELRPLAPPADLVQAATPAGMGFNVAQMYARYRDGLPLPDFAEAVRRHRLLDAITRAAASGQRQSLG
jgi:predicted dehydrogenase